MIDTGENINVETNAEGKYPQMVIKLSMIHCASRRGWKEENGNKFFLLDVQDIENAIKDLKMYKENFLWAYRVYQLKKTSSSKLEKIDEERKTVFYILENTPKEEKMNFRTESSKNIGYKDKNGEYVKLSYIYAKTRWNHKTVKNVLDAMVFSEEIETIKVNVKNTYKLVLLIRDIRNKKK